MKIEETFKKLQEIYSQTQYIIHSSNTELSKEVLNHLIQDMKQVRDGVMDVERLLMEDLQFDVEIIAPHRFALSFCKWINANESTAQEAWKVLNDSYLTDVSLKYPPHTIAFASVLCGLRLLGTNYSELLKDDRTYQSLSSSLADVAGDLSFDLDVGQILMSMYVESKSRSDSEKLAFGKIWREFAAITEAEADKKKQKQERLTRERETEREFRKSNSQHSLVSHHSLNSHHSNGTHQSRERSNHDSRGYVDKRDRDRTSSSGRISRQSSREDLRRPVLDTRGHQPDYHRYNNRYFDRPGAVESFERRHPQQIDRERSRDRDRSDERPSKYPRTDSRDWHGERDRERDQPRPNIRHSYGGRPTPREFHRDDKPYRK